MLALLAFLPACSQVAEGGPAAGGTNERLQAAEGALRAAQQAGGDRLAVCNE